jgi:hypothetical protein
MLRILQDFCRSHCGCLYILGTRDSRFLSRFRTRLADAAAAGLAVAANRFQKRLPSLTAKARQVYSDRTPAPEKFPRAACSLDIY